MEQLKSTSLLQETEIKIRIQINFNQEKKEKPKPKLTSAWACGAGTKKSNEEKLWLLLFTLRTLMTKIERKRDPQPCT